MTCYKRNYDIWFIIIFKPVYIISYIPCLRVALAALGGHRNGRGWLQQCHPQTRDVMILSSIFIDQMFPSNRLFNLHVLIDQTCDCLLLFRFSRLCSEAEKIQRVTQNSVSTSGFLQGDTESCVTLWLITGRHHAILLSCKPIISQHFITWPPYRVIIVHVKTMQARPNKSHHQKCLISWIRNRTQI